MPRLKDIECSIELANPQRKLQEHMSTYGDGVVETYIAVPNEPKPFAIHLTSSAYIAEGLAMYVFIDGVYQCNRNRRGLENRQPGKRLSDRTLVDFVVRQKEERQKDGEMIAREWRFEKLNTVYADQTTANCSANVIENIGCIEVVVLRCKGNRGPSHNMGMDGTNDILDGYFGWDSHVEDSSHGDRSLQGQQRTRSNKHRGAVSGFAYVQPMGHTTSQPPSRRASSNRGHPEYRSKQTAPYHRSSGRPSETSQHHDRSQRSTGASEPASRVSHIELPPGSYYYGTGPIRRGDHIGSVIDEFKDRTPSQMDAENIVDPEYLKELTENAYREGLKAAHRRFEMERQSNVKHQVPACDKIPQPPGAWPSTHDEIQTSKRNPRSESGKYSNSREQNDGDDWGSTSRSRARKAAIDQSGWHWPATRDNSPDSWQTSTWDTANEDFQYNNKAPHMKRNNSVSWGMPPAVSARSSNAVSCTGRSRIRSGWNNGNSNLTGRPVPSSGEVTPYRNPFADEGHSFRSTDGHWSNGPSSQRGSSNPRKASRIHEQTSKWGTPLKEKTTSRPDGWSPSSSQVTPQEPPIEHTPSRSRSRRSTLKPTKSPPLILTPLYTRNIPPPPPYGYDRQEPFQRSPPLDKSDPWGWENDNSSRKMPGSWDNKFDWNGKQNENDKVIGESSGENSWDPEGPKNKTSAWDATSRSSSSWGSDKNDVEHQNRHKTSGWVDRAKTYTAGREEPYDNWETQDWASGRKDTDAVAASPGRQDWKNKASSSDKQHIESGSEIGWGQQYRNTGDEVDPKYKSGNSGWNNTTTTWGHRGEQSTPSKSKGRLHSYRRLRDSGLKPHWQFPPPVPPKKLYPIIEDFETSSKVESDFILPKEPLYTIPFSVAEKKHIKHQVRAGHGEKYTHAINRPEYLDSLNHPYAVFKFKYRTRNCLKKMFPGVIPDEEPKQFVEELKSMSEEEKIAEILKLKEKLAGKKDDWGSGKVVGGGGIQNLTTTAPTHVKGWVQDQRQRSQHPSRGDASRRSTVQSSTRELQRRSKTGDERADQASPGAADVGSHKAKPTKEVSKSRSVVEPGWGTDGNDKVGTVQGDDDGWKDKRRGKWGGATRGWDSGETGHANVKW